jgi:hypothetical protein
VATLEELLVEIKADTSGLLEGLKQAQDSVSQSSKAMKDAIENMSSDSAGSVSRFSGAWQVMEGVIGAGAIEKALGMVADAAKEAFDILVVEGVRASIEQEDALNRLNNAFARAGEYSKEASHSFVEFADEMQRTTKYSNDAIISTGGLIESLAQLDEKGLKKATTAAMDLASGLGIDLNTAALLVGKAAEGNIQTFSRYGLAIETGATKAETFANALQAINEKFGGNAATEALTFSGALAQLNHTFADFQKAIGDTIVNNAAVIDVLKALTGITANAADGTKSMTLELKQLVGEGLIYAIKAAEVFGVTLDTIARIGTEAFNALRIAVDTAGLTITGVVGVFSKSARTMSDVLTQDIGEAAHKMGKALTEDTKISEINTMLAQLEHAAQSGFQKIGTEAEKTVEPVNRLHKAVKELSDELKAIGDAGKELAESLTKPSSLIATQFDRATQAAKTALSQGLIDTNTSYGIQEEALRKKLHDENSEITEAYMQKKISSDVYFKALEQNQKKFDTEEDKLKKEKKKQDDEDNKLRGERMKMTLGYLTSLQRSSSKELFFIGQQAAAAQATIDGIAAVQVALKAAPPPFNFALAALVGVATAANVAQIESQAPGFAGGLDSVPGNGFRDNFPAMLAPGEGVVTSENNKKLTKFLSGDGEHIQILKQIADGISKVGGQGSTVHVHIGGKVLVESLNDELRGGRKLAI